MPSVFQSGRLPSPASSIMHIFRTARPKAIMAVMMGACLTLSACATKSDRRGPPPERQGSDRPGKSSGTFLQPVGGLFLAMDTNRDKIISKAEAQSGIAAEWSSFTKRPSAAYFAQWSIAALGSIDAMPTFMSFDRDFNGVVTEEEFTAQLNRDFDRLDKNKDDALERSEMLIAFEAAQGRRRQQSGGEGGGKKRGGGGNGGGRPPSR